MIPAKLPAGLEQPGVYVTLVSGSDPGLSTPSKTCLIWGYKTTGYPGATDAPVSAISQGQVASDFGPSSMLAQRYAAARAQQPYGAEILLLPLSEPAGGTASAITITIEGEPASGVLSAATAAASADTVWLGMRGRGVWVDFKKGDTFAAIAAAIETKWADLASAPAALVRVGAALTLTAPHKGAFDNGAVECSFVSKGTSGVAASVGTVTVAGVAGGVGTVQLKLGRSTPTVAIAGGETAVQTGNKILAAINGSSYPVRLAQPSVATGVLTVFLVNGRAVRPLGFSSTETGIAPQTVTDAFGTQGMGVPAISAALSNLSAYDVAIKSWAPFWTQVAELGSLATHIEAQAMVPLQKGQNAVIGSTVPFADLAATNLATATSPRLDSSTRYPIVWAQLAPNADWEFNVRLCAAIAGEEYQGRNWNGFEFRGAEDAPLVPIHPADRPTLDPDEQNAAIATYRTAPVTVNSAGRLAITWGGNSYKPKGFKDAKLRKIATQITIDYLRSDLRNYLESRLGSSSPGGAKKIKVLSEPRTAYSTTPEEVKKLVFVWMKRADDADLFDGAEAKKGAIEAAVLVSPTRIDVNVPISTLADLDVVSAVGVIE